MTDKEITMITQEGCEWCKIAKERIESFLPKITEKDINVLRSEKAKELNMPIDDAELYRIIPKLAEGTPLFIVKKGDITKSCDLGDNEDNLKCDDGTTEEF